MLCRWLEHRGTNRDKATSRGRDSSRELRDTSREGKATSQDKATSREGRHTNQERVNRTNQEREGKRTSQDKRTSRQEDTNQELGSNHLRIRHLFHLHLHLAPNHPINQAINQAEGDRCLLLLDSCRLGRMLVGSSRRLRTTGSLRRRRHRALDLGGSFSLDGSRPTSFIRGSEVTIA